MIRLLVARPAARPVIFTHVALEFVIAAIIESKIAPCIDEAAVAVLPAELGRPRQQPVLVERREGIKRAALGLFFSLQKSTKAASAFGTYGLWIRLWKYIANLIFTKSAGRTLSKIDPHLFNCGVYIHGHRNILYATRRPVDSRLFPRATAPRRLIHRKSRLEGPSVAPARTSPRAAFVLLIKTFCAAKRVSEYEFETYGAAGRLAGRLAHGGKRASGVRH